MEKNEHTNGFEKYSEWLETIDKMCDESHSIGIAGDEEPTFLQNYEHYKLDNGLHVWKKDGKVIVSNGEIKDISSAIYMSKDKTSIEITMNSKNALAIINYGMEGTKNLHSDLGRDVSYLPANMSALSMDKALEQEQYQVTGDLSTDMKELLSVAIDRTENEETRRIYEEAIRLHDEIGNVILLDKLKDYAEASKQYVEHDDGYPEEIDVNDNSETLDNYQEDDIRRTLRDYDTHLYGSKAEDFDIDELYMMSMEDLESMLNSTIEDNSSKRTELENLKKKRLIAKIFEAQKEGQELDEKIAEARANNLENR